MRARSRAAMPALLLLATGARGYGYLVDAAVRPPPSRPAFAAGRPALFREGLAGDTVRDLFRQFNAKVCEHSEVFFRRSRLSC